MRKTLRKLMIFLTLSAGAGCASRPVSTKFDGKWEMCQPTPFVEPMACLNEADTGKLRKLLIQCGSEQR